MPETTVNLSEKEAELIEEYAEQNGITPEQALKDLYHGNLKNRLRFRRNNGVVKTFRLPKRD